MTTLLDANVLVALPVVDHVHHDSADEFWSASFPTLKPHWLERLGIVRAPRPTWRSWLGCVVGGLRVSTKVWPRGILT